MQKPNSMFRAGHRERLKQKLADGKLSGYEKLELLLTYAIPRRDVKPMAHALLNRFGTLHRVLHASMDDLEQVPGVGHSSALLIHLVHELINASFMERLSDGSVLQQEHVIEGFCRNLLIGKDVEEMHVLYLNHDYYLIADELHNRGTINEANAYPREIAKRAMVLNASAVILMHNHPMSNNSFSRDDVAFTQDVIAELERINVNFVDHYVVAANGVVHSIQRLGLLNQSSFMIE